MDQTEIKLIVKMDLKNAFNQASRVTMSKAIRRYSPHYYRFFKWSYNTSSALVMGYGSDTTYLESSEGVRQGDPFAPFAFSTLIRTTFPELDATTEAELTAAFLDDAFFVTNNADIVQVLQKIFPEEDSDTGLAMHPGKTEVMSLDALVAGTTSCRVLGSIVGDLNARRAFLVEKIDKLRPTLLRLRSMPAHHQYIVLRDSISKKLVHLLRTMDTTGLDKELRELDQLLWSVLFDILGFDDSVDDPNFLLRAGVIFHLPRAMGGLAVTSHTGIRDAARKASNSRALQELSLIFPEDPRFRPGAQNAQPSLAEEQADASRHVDFSTQKELVKEANDDLLSKFLDTLTWEQKVTFTDQASNVGTAWQQCTPNGNHRWLRDSQLREIFRTRCLLLPTYQRSACNSCSIRQSLGHEDTCGADPRNASIKTRNHNYIRDLIAQGAKNAGRSVVSEPLLATAAAAGGAIPHAVPQQTNNLRRADLRISMTNSNVMDPVFGVVDIKTRAVLTSDNMRTVKEAFEGPLDLTQSAQYAQDTRRSWNAIQAALERTFKTATADYAKLRLPHSVVPIVISAGGTLHKTTENFFKALGKDQGSLRRELCIDISMGLARRRAELRIACQALD